MAPLSTLTGYLHDTHRQVSAALTCHRTVSHDRPILKWCLVLQMVFQQQCLPGCRASVLALGLALQEGPWCQQCKGARHVHKVAASSRSFASAAPAAAEPEAAASEDVQMTDAAVEVKETAF